MKNKQVINELYVKIFKDKKLSKRLKTELVKSQKLDKDFIVNNILPLANEIDSNITWHDILEYEKENINKEKILNNDDLSNVSGGKFLNSFVSVGLLTMMGLSAIPNNQTSADFIKFNQTREVQNAEESEKEGQKFGDLPFYLQSDHSVNGIRWFKDPNKEVAFFVLDRELKNGEEKYACTFYKDIMKYEYKLLKVGDLEGLSHDLKSSYDEALNLSGGTPLTTRVLDNPLYNFARFYNPNYRFDSDAKRENLAKIPMYVSSEIPLEDGSPFSHVEHLDKSKESAVKISYAQKLKEQLKEKISWTLVHRTESNEKPEFKVIESAHNLKDGYGRESANTKDLDKEVLRNDGFTFFTLQVKDKKVIRLPFTYSKPIYEGFQDFKDIPLVSCSIDMLPRLKGQFSEYKYAFLPENFPCFNGSSEDVKEQIIDYYVNQKVKELKEEDCKESNVEEHVNEIIEDINNWALEVRVPTKLRIKQWEELNLEELFSD